MGYFINTTKGIGYYSASSKIDHADEEVTRKTAPDYVWVGSAWARGKAATITAIEKMAGQKIAEGYAFDGHTYQIAESPKNYRSNWVAIMALTASIESGTISAQTGGYVIDIDNNKVTISDGDLIALATGALYRFNAILNAARAHKDAVALLTDAQAADYDLTTGWPT